MDKRRIRYNGTYNDKWVKTVHPGLPEDTNPLLLNSAIEELQLFSPMQKYQYFQTGEKYTLYDLHPKYKVISGSLPNISVRLFANIGTAGLRVESEHTNLSFTEMPTHLETVWFFPEEGLGVALYRGVAQFQDSDGLDVKQLLMAYERAEDSPRSIDYYHNVLSLRTNPDTALANLFNESQLIPEKTQEEKQQLQAAIEQERSEKEKKIASLRQHYQQKAMDIVNKNLPENSPGYDDIAANINHPADEQPAYELPEIPAAVLESGDFDLTEFLQKADKLQEQLNAEMQAKQAEMEALADSYAEQYKDDVPVLEETLEQIQQRIANPVFCEAKELKARNSKKNSAAIAMNTSIRQLPSQAVKELAEEHDTDVDKLSENMSEAYDVLMASQKQARLASSVLTRQYQLSDEQQQYARQWVEDLIASEELLAGRDFSGIDLSGIDFSGQDMRDIMLEACDLSHCTFNACRLDGATLVAANIDGACFLSCSFVKANLSRVKGTKASFDSAIFKNSFLIEAEVENSDFSHCHIEHLVATDAHFIKSRFTSATVTQSQFLQADLSFTDWSLAQI